MAKIGLQLYSIKELTGQDFFGTLKQVADIGFDGVEFAGYYNTPASTLRKVLDDLNLEAAGSHVGLDKLTNNLNEVIDYSLEIGDPFIICPALPSELRISAEGYLQAAELFNKIGQQCKVHGIQFGYHNHDFEFQMFDGKYGMDILLENTDPSLVQWELDTYWVEYPDLKAIDWMKKYQTRLPILHIKEMAAGPDKVSTQIGQGVLDFPTIVNLGKEFGVQWYTIEQEEFSIPQLQAVQEGFTYLKDIL